MELYHSTDMDGLTEINPSEATMREILARLDSPDAAEADHPDVSLIHDASGWTLSVFPSGVVTCENLDEEDVSPRYMSSISRSQTLQMWQQLAKGEIAALLTLPWLEE